MTINYHDDLASALARIHRLEDQLADAEQKLKAASDIIAEQKSPSSVSGSNWSRLICRSTKQQRHDAGCWSAGSPIWRMRWRTNRAPPLCLFLR